MWNHLTIYVYLLNHILYEGFFFCEVFPPDSVVCLCESAKHAVVPHDYHLRRVTPAVFLQQGTAFIEGLHLLSQQCQFVSRPYVFKGFPATECRRWLSGRGILAITAVMSLFSAFL